ncbi:zinc-binding alcohol dehydrogenase family protein [Legionella sp. MW5194]|uniref:zinc-dependent alcohol dehydrogenase family protein n=1 Tax=Legionella sp. MW5194 TaxID=2662448 RepID=UPI00193E9432|nr:zinc-dependent alcohol dehydrogenase family protein [Legionella sp. MW5194]QRN05173.1 zinc-binding alcohol dehydrogenase family protein [Legionella sp. MW5194]
MRAMVMENNHQKLIDTQIEKPTPNAEQILIKITACGVCRTDLHVVDGELKHPKRPLVPGHQIVGVIEAMGEKVRSFTVGQRIGVPWLGGSCGVCQFCLTGRENLCDEAKFTGYQIDGGFAEYCVANHRFCFPLPNGYSDVQAAPLFCAGLIGYRALLKTMEAKHLGLYGFGSAAHILTQVACKQGRKVYAFTRSGDTQAQEFARQLGATWAGDANQSPPHRLDAAIIFAPVGSLVPLALQQTRKGGTVVCAGIHMSDIPAFPYELLWGERTLCSVANLTRKDGEEFLSLAPTIPVKTEIHTYPLTRVNEALDDLRQGRFTGSAVILINKAVAGQ